MNRNLADIIKGIELEILGNSHQDISGIQLDSRKVESGNLFVAVKGTQSDGHVFIEQAIRSGAAAVLCEVLPQHPNPGIVWLKSMNSSEALGKIASAFYGHPSQDLIVTGITGTNGKTTVATLLFDLFTNLGYYCGLISTVVNRIGSTHLSSTHTTPDAIRLQQLLYEMKQAGCTHVFMEVSSHALDQHRVAGLRFSLAIFTNITHDHLDYHHTFENYIKAKKLLFDHLDPEATALVNADDRNAKVMVQNSKASVYRYGLKSPADFKARILEKDLNGMQLHMGETEAWFRLVGTFNASNLLAVYSAAFILGENSQKVIESMTRLHTVSGRFETLRSQDGVVAVVDYAHTPDALENVLKTINDIRSRNENLITVIGCGGNRDQEKRPLMARVATELSDRVILTSDNPRDEDPQEIIRQMQQGVPAQHHKKVLVITDRKEAIRTAVLSASKGDIILIAGKGHERYQEIKGERQPFDDRDITHQMFQLRIQN